MNKVAAICGPEVEIRCQANQCYNKYLPCENGICGTYIRPEDMDLYEPFIQHIFFITDELQKERTLIKIYKEKKWPGNLNLLLNNLNYDIDNRAFDDRFVLHRLNCHHKCQENRCNFCRNYFDLITSIDRNQDWLRE